jgi:hypothetical protein
MNTDEMIEKAIEENCPEDDEGYHSWVYDKSNGEISQYHCRNCGKVVVD